MDSFAHKKELLEFLSFIEVISLEDIKNYWKINDDINIFIFKNIESIDINYESNELYISKGDISNNPQSLEKSKEFIVFLIKNNRLSRFIARKITTIDEFYALFEPGDVLNILYRAEEYKKCIDYYTNHISDFDKLIDAQVIYQQSLSKVGDYIYKMSFTDKDINLALAIMRNLWQKGAFSSAKNIADIVEKKLDELDCAQKCIFLNNKIRILRDMGKIQETEELLKEFEVLLVNVHKNNSTLYIDLKGKYLYNQAINYYLTGNFDQCIAFCKKSLEHRTDKYSNPYVKLREARCFIFQGNCKEYRALQRTIRIDPSDEWAHSLFLTVQSEYNRFILGNTDTAIKLLKESNKIETLNGADTVYTDIALLYLYIERKQKQEIMQRINRIDKYKEYIDGELAFLTANIALDMLDGKNVNDRIVELYKNEKYQHYPVYLFVSLFSLAKLFEKLDSQFPITAEDLHFNNGFSKELVSAFSKKMRVLIIYSWWDKYGKEDTENKSWVNNLNVALRRQGICSFFDKIYEPNANTDSRKLIQVEAYDKFIVILNEGFKERIAQGKGILCTEYKEVLNILDKNPNKIILVRRGENDSVSPEELKYKEKIDMTSSKLQNRRDKELLGLVRVIKNSPYYDLTIPLVNEDIPSEPIAFV